MRLPVPEKAMFEENFKKELQEIEDRYDKAYATDENAVLIGKEPTEWLAQLWDQFTALHDSIYSLWEISREPKIDELDTQEETLVQFATKEVIALVQDEIVTLLQLLKLLKKAT